MKVNDGTVGKGKNKKSVIGTEIPTKPVFTHWWFRSLQTSLDASWGGGLSVEPAAGSNPHPGLSGGLLGRGHTPGRYVSPSPTPPSSPALLRYSQFGLEGAPSQTVGRGADSSDPSYRLGQM